ncbi:tryptophan--tRNA ligase [Candidatus Woesearchaeota archaeon]|jgi:tryptophanyl-tRNA synthetase|nr:tryptophan--tRNA ligase [Candidatus Woesearchaeota archaeon]MBT5272778.1 tryptophan--tRNA ligase [Candidatus Woesearchaeota archaeon]MBT6040390.1 tryptophan--tRNA ligase [Candidatus Woesearchaeota archaeon]MBT6336977.1 tryptophan--tRNA ligase [Candidatus Woesearchaeota archaeon]MBT7926863.1 tryptophan--tRNA ligase [Candidatus Woesearchaeota archaeon]
MKKIIDPWGSELVEDYVKIVKDFGLDKFDIKKFPKPNRLMRRHTVFAGRDLSIIAKCIKEKKPYYVLTGIMPSADKLHFGNKMVIEQVKYFQENGAKTFVLVADLEAATTRGITLEEAQRRALEFHIPAWIALGLDPKKTTFYFQSENKDVMHLAYKFAKKVTLNEFKAIYGQADPSRILAAVTQVGDILYPQLKERMPGIVPVGIDQDPHIRLTRDVVRRTKAEKYFLPAGIYHKFTSSLNGDMKMSKSHPQSCVELPEDFASVKKKIMRAVTGGRETLELHRKLGAEVEKCMVFELLKTHLVEDDKELEKIYKAYKSGKMSSGEIKQIACEKMEAFLKKFTKDLKKAQKDVKKLKFVKFS